VVAVACCPGMCMHYNGCNHVMVQAHLVDSFTDVSMLPQHAGSGPTQRPTAWVMWSQGYVLYM